MESDSSIRIEVTIPWMDNDGTVKMGSYGNNLQRKWRASK